MPGYAKYYDDVLAREADAIASLKQSLDYQSLDRVVDLLLSAKQQKRRFIVAGCGTSGQAARKIAHTLNCIEVPAFFMSVADSPHGGMGAIQEGDVMVLITKGGNTPEMLAFVDVCRKKKVLIIGMTNNAGSALARESDITILIDSGEEPDQWKLLPCCSTLAAIAVWDAIICTAMRFNGFTREDFLLIHPGGATGEKLRT